MNTTDQQTVKTSFFIEVLRFGDDQLSEFD